jgi:hypothetical protein
VPTPQGLKGPLPPSRFAAWGRIGPALAVALLAFLFQLPFFRLWFSPMDEGHMLQFSQIVAEGGALYRDATLYPLPGAFWLLALVFRITGPSILVARWVVMIEFALFCGLIWLLVRPLLTRAGALGLVALLLLYRVWAFPHWQFYSYSTTGLLVQLAMLVALLGFFASGNRRPLALAGLLFGLGVLCKQDYGAAFLLAVSLALLVYASHAQVSRAGLFAWFLAPAALVGACAGLYFLRQGTLRDVIHQTVWNHFVGMSSFKYTTFPKPWPLFTQDPSLRDRAGLGSYIPAIVFTADWAAFRDYPLYLTTAWYEFLIRLLYYGPPLFLLGGGVRLWLCRRRLAGPDADRYLRELLIWLVGATLIALVWLNRPQDYAHLAVLTWPLLCLLPVYACEFTRRGTGRAILFTVLLGLPALGIAGYSARLLIRLRAVCNTPVDVARARGILVKPEDAFVLRDLVSYVHENSRPGETLAVLPYSPLINFLAERPAPCASCYIVWPFAEYPDRDDRVIRAMETAGTNVVLWDFTQFPNFPPAEEYAPKVFAYLVSYFQTDRVFVYGLFDYRLMGLHRRREPEPGKPLLSAGAPPPPARIEPSREADHATRHGGEGGPLIARQTWPFRPVLALRPTMEGRTVATIPFQVPSAVHLHTAVGTHPSLWSAYPPAAVHVTLDLEVDGKRERVFERELDPNLKLEDRGWFDVDIPLESYAGRSVELELGASTGQASGENLLRAGFAEPRLLSDEPEAAP